MGVAVASSLVVWLWPYRTSAEGILEAKPPIQWIRGFVAGMLGLVLTVFLMTQVTVIPWGMVAYGRFMATHRGEFAKSAERTIVSTSDVPYVPDLWELYCTYMGEGMNVTVAVTQAADGTRSFHGAGKVQHAPAANARAYFGPRAQGS
jgi:hypothetical protein